MLSMCSYCGQEFAYSHQRDEHEVKCASKVKEQAEHSLQQLKAEISSLATEFEFRYKHGAYIEMDVLISKLRQLSAV